eukprot:807763-Prymnesium_polylepis.2
MIDARASHHNDNESVQHPSWTVKPQGPLKEHNRRPMPQIAAARGNGIRRWGHELHCAGVSQWIGQLANVHHRTLAQQGPEKRCVQPECKVVARHRTRSDGTQCPSNSGDGPGQREACFARREGECER